MSLVKLTRHLLVFVIVLLCLAPARQALSQSDQNANAREIANAIDDDAVSREARQAALEKLKEAARLFLSANENVEAARVLNRVGHFQLVLREPQEAIASYKRALALLKTSPSIEAEVDSWNGLASAYPVIEEKAAAEAAARKALTLSVTSEYKRGQAEALLALSDSQNYYDHPLALRTAQEALEVWRTVGDKQGLARTYSQIGRCYLAQNILGDSTDNYQEALRLWQELNILSEQAEALVMLGFIEFRKGDWQSCITLLTQAERLLDEKAEPFKMGQIAATLADCFNQSGLPEIALTHSQRALEYFRQTKNSHAIRRALWAVGSSYYLLGRYPEALTQFQDVLVEIPPEDSLVAAQNYESLGRVYIALGDPAAALNHLRSALAIYASAGNPKESAQVIGLMGQAHEQQEQFGLARQNYQRALQMFTKLSDRLNEGAVYYALGRLEMKSRNYDPAENYLRQSIDATETVRRVSTSSDLTAAFSATIQERYERYIECLMIKDHADPNRGLSVRAFQTSELARGRSLAELLKATETNLAPGLDLKLAEVEKSLRQSLKVKEDAKIALLSGTYKKEDLAKLEAELLKFEKDYKQVTEIIKERYPAYAQISQPTVWNLEQIQEQVVADDETLLLEYSLGADKSYVWAITRNNITSAELPRQELINEAARKVYALLQNPPDPQAEAKLTQAAEELSQMILSPVAGQLNKRRVIVVADGALNYVPFQLIPLPLNHDEMLTEHEVINAPSASILGQLQQESARRRQPEKALAAFGDPVFPSNYAQIKGTNAGEQVASAQTLNDERWRPAVRDIEVSADSLNPFVIQPLFFAKRELANLQEVSGQDAFVATGFDASLDKLQSTDLTRYAILHFATHGILDPKRPEKSGLLLSMVNRDGQPQNGFVGLQEIYRLHLPVDLVVLSACRTGLGKDVKGEGLIGLTRGFMYAGASSVLASLWKVDDEATAELMKRFYANMLQRGMTPAAALRAAQNSIRQEPQWRAPYYWAAFTLQGEYRHVIKPVNANGHFGWLMVFALGLLSLLLLGLAWRYRRHRRMKTA